MHWSSVTTEKARLAQFFFWPPLFFRFFGRSVVSSSASGEVVVDGKVEVAYRRVGGSSSLSLAGFVPGCEPGPPLSALRPLRHGGLLLGLLRGPRRKGDRPLLWRRLPPLLLLLQLPRDLGLGVSLDGISLRASVAELQQCRCNLCRGSHQCEHHQHAMASQAKAAPVGGETPYLGPTFH